MKHRRTVSPDAPPIGSCSTEIDHQFCRICSPDLYGEYFAFHKKDVDELEEDEYGNPYEKTPREIPQIPIENLSGLY
jgi:hypothetical protein